MPAETNRRLKSNRLEDDVGGHSWSADGKHCVGEQEDCAVALAMDSAVALATLTGVTQTMRRGEEPRPARPLSSTDLTSEEATQSHHRSACGHQVVER